MQGAANARAREEHNQSQQQQIPVHQPQRRQNVEEEEKLPEVVQPVNNGVRAPQQFDVVSQQRESHVDDVDLGLPEPFPEAQSSISFVATERSEDNNYVPDYRSVMIDHGNPLIDQSV